MFDRLLLRVAVFVSVVVFVEVDDRVPSRDCSELLVLTGVLVDVFEEIADNVGTIFSISSSLPIG